MYRVLRDSRGEHLKQPVFVMDGDLEIIPGYGVTWALCRRKH